jgi:ABC-type uncharacterized transport system substrate-binding protein
LVSYKDHPGKLQINSGIEMLAVPASSALKCWTLLIHWLRIELSLCQISDNLTGSCSSAILKVSLNSKIPYYGFVTEQIHQGAVAVCARDYFQAGYESGQMGIEVLSGKNPAQMPYRYVEKTDYLINPEAARLYDISIRTRYIHISAENYGKEHHQAQ